MQQTYGYLPSRRESPPLDRYKLYCVLTEARVCEQLAQPESGTAGVEPATVESCHGHVQW